MKDNLYRDMFECDNHYEARKLWNDFVDNVLYKNRFFVKHPLLDILTEYIKENIIEIESGQIFWRARIIDDKAIKDHMVYKCYGAPDDEKPDIRYHSKANKFRGLTQSASFVPPKEARVTDGRANPKYVRYLYMSEQPTTALFEVRPLLFAAVNLAKIRVNEPLKIANIAVGLDISESKDAPLEQFVMGKIQGAFSTPTNDSDDYIPTQVIAEHIKSLGYDGIRFNSSLHSGGVNYTVFPFEKCEAISSQDFRIEEININARAAFGCSEYQGDLAYIIDNEPRYLDFEPLRRMEEMLEQEKQNSQI